MARLRKKRHACSVEAYYCACMGACDCGYCVCSCSCNDPYVPEGSIADSNFIQGYDSTSNYRYENYSPLRDAIHTG